MAEPEGLVAELWYVEAPDLNDPVLLEGFRASAPGIQAQDGSFVVPYAGAELPPPLGSEPVQPLVTMILPGSSVEGSGKTLPDTSQTWDWPEADAALESARASVLVVERYADPYAPRDRAAALTSVVAARAGAPNPRGGAAGGGGAPAPLAVSWPTSQRVTDPARPAVDALHGLLNVRLFTVADEEDERLMDTRGLAPFGLPDVQMHFRDLEVSAVAGMLYATGSYVFEAGDVIGDGDTIPGPDGDEHWRCQHEDALVAPPRTVIDVDPGDPYAAGRRAR